MENDRRGTIRYDRPPRPRSHPSLGETWRAPATDIRPRSAAASDRRIEWAVRTSLARDFWLDADGIDVSVEDGVVTLEGEVEDYLAARYAWDDAWETKGVRGVRSMLRVRRIGDRSPAGRTVDRPD